MPKTLDLDDAHRSRSPKETAKVTILRAAGELLAERGLRQMTIEDVATRAGVGKSTIYRRWPSKGSLALDAFLQTFLATQPAVNTGTLEGDLHRALSFWVTTVDGTSTGRSLASLIAEVQLDPDLRFAWRENFLEVVRAQHRQIVAHAVSRGEIPRDSDANLIIDMLFGPAYHRLMHGHLALSNEFVAGDVAMVVAGAKAGAAVPPKPSALP
ncbi:MAG: TetR/AcrR family transcriptional regulator [Acidimicrobiales bacterium]